MIYANDRQSAARPLPTTNYLLGAQPRIDYVAKRIRNTVKVLGFPVPGSNIFLIARHESVAHGTVEQAFCQPRIAGLLALRPHSAHATLLGRDCALDQQAARR